jgi:hypothetical protein
VSGTLYFVFVLAAIVCVIAGVVAVTRTRRASREAEADEVYPEMSYADEQAAVAKAQAAEAAEAERLSDDESEGELPA